MQICPILSKSSFYQPPPMVLITILTRLLSKNRWRFTTKSSFAQSTTLWLPCSLQNLRTICWPSRTLPKWNLGRFQTLVQLLFSDTYNFNNEQPLWLRSRMTLFCHGWNVYRINGCISCQFHKLNYLWFRMDLFKIRPLRKSIIIIPLTWIKWWETTALIRKITISPGS